MLGVEGVVEVWIVQILAGADLILLELLIRLLIALADLQLLLEFGFHVLGVRLAEAKRRLACFAMLDEFGPDGFIAGEPLRLTDRSLIGRPCQVALADAHHGFAQGQREVRICPAPQTPHTDDAEARLIETNWIPIERIVPFGADPEYAATQGFAQFLIT